MTHRSARADEILGRFDAGGFYLPGDRRLPGHNPRELMFDGVVDFIPEYYCGENEFVIRDPVWGDCIIENKGLDRIWFKLLDNPLVQRSAGIEQLTLEPALSTVPNTGYFSRWEHIWGSVAFVRRMIDDHGQDWELDDRQKLILQLRTFVSDLGHTAFSHLGDWMFQGAGGAENQHDLDLPEILRVSGIADILTEFDMSLDEVVFPEVDDWIESASPDLCTDRVDYSVREINRWHRLVADVWTIRFPDMFKVTGEGELVMTSEDAARRYARSFAVMPNEHWGEPTHRLQLQLLEEMVKRSFTENHALQGEPYSLQRRHPRDWMYILDDDFITNTVTSDRFMWVMRDLAESIGLQKRRIFSQSRGRGIGAFLMGHTKTFPMPGHKLKGSWHGDFPQYPNNLEVVPVASATDVDDFGENRHTVDFFLPPLKARMVKPKYIDTDGTVKRLDEQDEDMASVYRQLAIASGQAYVARVQVASEYKKVIERGIKHNRVQWPELLKLPHMDGDEFRRILGRTGLYSTGKWFDIVRER